MSTPDLTKPLIMVVDDEWLNRDLMQSILELYDFRVELANNGQNALNAAQQFHPDLILLDIRMPDMDGYEVCRRLKSVVDTQDIVIVMVSGVEGNEQERQAATAAGADSFILRTLPVEDIIAHINTLLHSKAHD